MKVHAWLFNTVGKAPLFTNMSLIYSDSFHNDEDLCNILAALQLGSRPTSVAIPQAAVRDTSTRVTQAASTRQHAPNETPADRSSLVLYDHLRTPVVDPVGKYPHICSLFCILLIIFTCIRPCFCHGRPPYFTGKTQCESPSTCTCNHPCRMP
jgi:hypothetical protein